MVFKYLLLVFLTKHVFTFTSKIFDLKNPMIEIKKNARKSIKNRIDRQMKEYVRQKILLSYTEEKE